MNKRLRKFLRMGCARWATSKQWDNAAKPDLISGGSAHAVKPCLKFKASLGANESPIRMADGAVFLLN